uniref:Transposase n=1 Tax=Cyprinus carpio TaxID=7962 RepID=A0A8C2F823_CYPCA
MLEIIVLPLLTMVTCKEMRAAIIAVHKNGFTGKDIVATKIAPKSTIYRFIKNFKERGSILVKKASGRPRKSSKRQDRLLKRIQLRDRSATSAELAQEWQQAGVSASARTVRRRLLEDGLVSRRAAKKPLLSKKNIRDRLIFCRKYSEWTAEDWGKVIFSDEAPFRLFGASGKRLVRRRKGERYHQSCVMPTVKHPDTIHVWGCFSSKGVGSLTILPKNTAMNKEWYQNTLQQQLLPTTQQQFGEEQCIFQHDGAPCHKAKVITKWLGDQNVEILGPWPGNSPDLNPIENLWSILKRRVDKQKPTNSDKLQEVIMKEWVAISQDLAQKLIESMPSRIAEVLKKKGQHCKY